MEIGKAIPVILDTDIGGDIDDTWALGMLLNSPELDPKMILTCTADTVYRSRLVCRFLDCVGRAEIPVGVGIRKQSDGPRERQKGWIEEYQLSDYPGTVFENGVGEAIRMIEELDEVTIIAIGPLTNIAAICQSRPDLMPKCRLVAMLGSIEYAHRRAPGAIAEFNVCKDISAAQTVFAANWKNITITPLDTCGDIVLDGENYRRVLSSGETIPQCIIDNYRVWLGSNKETAEHTSSVLFDTVAVYLAFADDLLVMKPMQLIIDDAGYTRQSEHGRPVDVAIDWKSEESFNELLVTRLLNGPSGKCGSFARER